MRLEQVETIVLPLGNGSELTFSNVAYAPECNSNLISLGQLRETGILYHNYPEYIVLKQRGNVIGVATRKKNLFVLDTRSLSDKVMLVKGRGRPTYLLSKNPQIKLWHHRLGHALNARVIKASKLTNGIDITIKDDQQSLEKCFSSDSEKDNEDNSSKPSLDSVDIFPIPITTLLNKMTSTIDHDDSVKQLCDPCIENKYTKIIRHKRMTPIIHKFQEIHADLWGAHDLPSLSRRTYVGLLLNKFTRKS